MSIFNFPEKPLSSIISFLSFYLDLLTDQSQNCECEEESILHAFSSIS